MSSRDLKKIIKQAPWVKMVVLLGADIFLISFSIWFSFFLRFEGAIPEQYFSMIRSIVVLASVYCIPIFYFTGLYSFTWSYVGIGELISLMKASAIGFIFLTATIYFSKEFPVFTGYPRSTLIISFCMVVILCGSARFAKRIYKSLINKEIGKSRTLIVGAGDAGEQILRSILSSSTSEYFPIGFVDDNNNKKGVFIHGLKVLGGVADIPEVIERNKISQLIIALPSAGSEIIREAVELAKISGVKKIKITPPLSEIINGQISFGSLKDVDVVDLLNRNEFILDTTQIENFIKNKTVLITGAAGSIGSELSRQVSKFNPALVLLLDQDETGIFSISEELKKTFLNLKIKSIIADVADGNKIDGIIKNFKPQIVFHAAAYKHVPLMEENPDEAVKNNVFGTENLAKACVANGVERFVFISTDKAVNPISIMGSTKRIGEMICQAFNKRGTTKFISVRFGNVLDSRGSVIPIFREQIKKGGPIEVTHPDMKRYFMLIPEACLLVMQSGAIGEGGEVFVLDMGKPVKILDLAKEMIRLSGLTLDKDIAIVFTGIRPGEKLFEDILTAEEGTGATKYQRIFKAKLKDINEKEFSDKLNQLRGDFRNIVVEDLNLIIK
jgi:FlaA1/EpsC-like NDP-sugar epimerase